MVIALQGDVSAEVRALFLVHLWWLVRWSSAHYCGMYPAPFSCEDCEQVSYMYRDEMASLVGPRQLGFGSMKWS